MKQFYFLHFTTSAEYFLSFSSKIKKTRTTIKPLRYKNVKIFNGY